MKHKEDVVGPKIRQLDLARLGDPKYVRVRLIQLRRAREAALRRLRQIEDLIVTLEEEAWRLSGRDLLRGRGDGLGGEDHGRGPHQD